MSSLATALVSYDEFAKLPAHPYAKRYELHDGEIVVVPPARPVHIALQMRLVELLRPVEGFGFIATPEYPYKPAPNYQFWYADVAVLPRSVRDDMNTWQDYRPYAPPLVIEILSPSNTIDKLAKQRIASMSHGTREFWVVDGDLRTVHSTASDGKVQQFEPGCSVGVLSLGMPVPVAAIFDAHK